MFKIFFDNGLSLNYILNDSINVVPQWKAQIEKLGTDSLCKINHKSCTGKSELVSQKIARLYELADTLNRVIPNSIPIEQLTDTNSQSVLNKMHVHFPVIHSTEELADYRTIASEYNDLIHWLEPELRHKDNSRLRIFLDFNKSEEIKFLDLNTEDYVHFTPYTEFGDLSLHYCHVGRHAFELFTANDLDCPEDQFVPQSSFTASCVLWFNNPESQKYLLPKWKVFYIKRGGSKFFKFKFGDPNLRFGYLKIGKLSEVTYNNKTISFDSLSEINIIKDLLTSASVTHWSVH
jgi:hypothetical protein